MSMAWEVTEEDITQVLVAHNVTFTDEVSEQVCEDDVEAAVLSYVDFDNQVTAALCEIEDQLIAAGVIKGEKKFNPPEGDDEWEDEDDE
jgi:hypothetical protein